jgi:hypothetical protein
MCEIYSIYFRYIYIPRESIPLSISGYVYTEPNIAFVATWKNTYLLIKPCFHMVVTVVKIESRSFSAEVATF